MAKQLSGFTLGSALLVAAACGGEKLVTAPTYTLAPGVGRVGDIPGQQQAFDAGLKPIEGCVPLNPPVYCKAPGDCPDPSDICISYTCEPQCFSQCGDYPPGLPDCPSPLVCMDGVCTVQTTTGGSGTTTGGSGTTIGTTSGTHGTTSGTHGTSGTGTTSGTSTTSGTGTTSGCTDPDLSGDWSQTSYYYIATGVANGYPGLLGIINEVSNFLNTWAYAFAIPSWVPLIFNDLSQFDSLFNNLWVQADQELVKKSNPYDYTCTETWQNVQVMIQGQWTQVEPADGYNSPSPYEVDTCNGTTTFQNHDISGAVTGLIGPLLDAIVQADCEIQGCSYSSFSDLMTNILSDLIDCSSLNDGSIFGQIAQDACQSAENSVVSDITNAINNIPLGIGICKVQASVPTSQTELTGAWQGTVSGTPFPGTLDAVNNN
jgi:hypothetical protein